MISSTFPSFEQKASNLRAYLSTTDMMRRLVSRYPKVIEPSILEDELAAVSAAAPDGTRWRVMEHTLTVSHLYALYESFCEELLADWITFLTPRFKFSELPERIKGSYREGFSYISGILPSSRYPNLSIEGLVKNYNAALQAEKEYSLDPDCLTLHKNNLRWADLCQIFRQSGLENIGAWVEKNDEVVNYFGGDDRHLIDRVSAKLADLIQYRNDCSHGLVGADEILGRDALLDFIGFVAVILSALDQLILWKKLEVLVAQGGAASAGRVTEVFKVANAFICTSKSRKFELNQKIFIKSGASLGVQMIDSIRLNGQPVEVVDADDGMELGIQCQTLPKRGSEIYVAL